MDDGRPWQTRLGINYMPTTNTDFDGGSTVEFNSSTGFLVGIGYDLSKHFEVGANFTYDERELRSEAGRRRSGRSIPGQGQP